MTLDIKQRNHINVVITATTTATESEPFELVSERSYTILSSTLGLGETVTVHVYDYATEAFIPMKVGGDTVYMTQNYQVLTFSNVSCVIKLVKSITASAVGVSILSR